MHEAGLANAIADTVRREHRPEAHVRVLVSGGHHGIAEFDASLRFHLLACAPDLDPAHFEIVHLPAERLCVWCGETFESVDPDDPCPCGGTALPDLAPERVTVEFLRPDVAGP